MCDTCRARMERVKVGRLSLGRKQASPDGSHDAGSWSGVGSGRQRCLAEDGPTRRMGGWAGQAQAAAMACRVVKGERGEDAVPEAEAEIRLSRLRWWATRQSRWRWARWLLRASREVGDRMGVEQSRRVERHETSAGVTSEWPNDA